MTKSRNIMLRYGQSTQGIIYINIFRWTQGKYGDSYRIPLQDSEKILDAINNGKLDNVQTYKFKHFNFDVPKKV